MQSLIDLGAILTLAFALIFALFLLRHLHGERFAHRLLSALLFIVVLEKVNYLVWSFDVIYTYPFLFNTFNNFGILFGTLLYFYTIALTDSRFEFKTSHWPHLIPPLLVLCYNIAFYHSLSTQQQLALLNGNSTQFAWGQYVWSVVLLGHGCIFAYLLASLKVLKNNGVRLRRVLSDVEPFNLTWLKGVVAVFLLIWLLRISKIPINALGNITLMEQITLIQTCLTLLGIITLLYKAMQQHPVFTRQLAELAEIPQLNDSDAEQSENRLEYIRQVMSQQRLWRQPSLTLAELAEHVGMEAKVVSAVLNDDLKKNFFEFVNEHRCLDAAEQLRQSEKAVLDIAFAAGFNSKTAFNRAFKRCFELTPSQYRNKHQSLSH